jgi:hypothetical protein
MDTSVSERKTSTREIRFCGVDGRIIWTQVDSLLDLDENGDFQGHVWCITDITARKKLEEEQMQRLRDNEALQRRRADEAEESKRQQERYIDMVSCKHFFIIDYVCSVGYRKRLTFVSQLLDLPRNSQSVKRNYVKYGTHERRSGFYSTVGFETGQRRRGARILVCGYDGYD